MKKTLMDNISAALSSYETSAPSDLSDLLYKMNSVSRNGTDWDLIPKYDLPSGTKLSVGHLSNIEPGDQPESEYVTKFLGGIPKTDNSKPRPSVIIKTGNIIGESKKELIDSYLKLYECDDSDVSPGYESEDSIADGLDDLDSIADNIDDSIDKEYEDDSPYAGEIETNINNESYLESLNKMTYKLCEFTILSKIFSDKNLIEKFISNPNSIRLFVNEMFNLIVTKNKPILWEKMSPVTQGFMINSMLDIGQKRDMLILNINENNTHLINGLNIKLNKLLNESQLKKYIRRSAVIGIAGLSLFSIFRSINNKRLLTAFKSCLSLGNISKYRCISSALDGAIQEINGPLMDECRSIPNHDKSRKCIMKLNKALDKLESAKIRIRSKSI